MKKLFAIVLLFAFLAQLSGKLFIYTSYELNKDFIASNLCENKEVEEMNCEGFCYLKKELQKEEERSSNPVNNLKEKTETWFSENKLEIAFSINALKIFNTPTLGNLIPQDFIPNIFHPPLVK